MKKPSLSKANHSIVRTNTNPYTLEEDLNNDHKHQKELKRIPVLQTTSSAYCHKLNQVKITVITTYTEY